MKVRFTILIMSIFFLSLSLPVMAQQKPLLTLDEAIDTAMKENRMLQADQFDAQAANWGTGASVSNYLPKVYFVSTWTRIDEDTFDEANALYEQYKQFGVEQTTWEDMYQSYISVSQPIFNGGSEIAGILAANANRKERSYNLQNSRLALVRDVKVAYYSVLSAQQLQAVADESVALAEESLKVAKSRFEVGQINKSEVLRWEANRADAEVTRIDAEIGLESAELAMSNLLGVDMTNRYAYQSPTTEQIDTALTEVDQKDLKKFPDTAQVSAHPSIKQAGQMVSLAKVDRFSSVGMFLPKANFTYNYNWEQNDTMDLDGDNSWTMGIQLQIPLFQGLGAVFSTGQSHKSVRKAQRTKEDVTRTFLQQLQLAQLNLASAKNRVTAARASRQFAKENLDLVQSRHKLGMANNLELIDAKFAYTQASSKLISSLKDFYEALANYEYLTTKSE